MLDALTLDQLRVLLVVVETGSFSAAGRRLRRVQSAISQAMANLEAQLGLIIWDRRARIPRLTDAGRGVVVAARRVCAEVDELRRLAAGMAAGLEAEVSLCVDALMPVAALVDYCAAFAAAYPTVGLRVDSQTMSAVSARVLAGSATLGVTVPMGVLPGLERVALAPVHMVPVVAPGHPLARRRGRLSSAQLGEHVQVVLSERGGETTGVPDQAVLSPRTWRVADLHTKHALLLAGLGWGNLPAPIIADDLTRGRLIRIRPDAWADDEHTLHLTAVYRSDAVLGPAHRWTLDRLAQLCRSAAKPGVSTKPKPAPKARPASPRPARAAPA